MEQKWKAAIVILSDKGYAGEREDKSGPLIKEMLEMCIRDRLEGRRVAVLANHTAVARFGDGAPGVAADAAVRLPGAASDGRCV